MKKTFSILFIALFAVLTWSCSDDDDTPVPPSDLPTAADTFISTYFSGDKIVRVEREGEHSGAEYDVIFASGYEVEFNAQGAWIDVDAPMGMTIPSGIAPLGIESYIATNYPTQGINEISVEYYGYEVELLNGIELMFDQQGNFIGIDY